MDLLQPASVDELISLLVDDEDTKVIAGGTAVVLMMQQGLIFPGRLASLRKIAGLCDVRTEDSRITIGAGATLRDVAGSEAIRQAFPVLARACEVVGNVRIRNVATLGGNLAEADYASDPPAALVSLGATVEIQGRNGQRESSVEDLLTGFYSTSLDHTEVITAIHIPSARPPDRQVYLKYRSRSSEDRPCVGVAACSWLGGDGVTIERMQVAVGAASATPQRFPELEQSVSGQALTSDFISAIADGYAESIDALDDLRGSDWYRRQMTRVFVKRALVGLTGEEGDA